MVRYNLKHEEEQKRFVARCEKLFDKQAIVELTEKTGKSKQQNAYIHVALAYGGGELGYTLEEIKTTIKRDMPDLFMYEKNGIKFLRSMGGNWFTKEVAQQFIERMLKWFAEHEQGVHVPTPEEYEQRSSFYDDEVEKYKKFW